MASRKREENATLPDYLKPVEWRELAELEQQLANGEQLGYEGNRTYKRLLAKRKDAEFLEYCQSMPKKIWSVWSGRESRVLLDQSANYGIPLDKPTVCLPDVAKWVHDFLKEHGAKINAMEEGGSSNASSPNLERQRKAQAERVELWLAKERKNLIPREVIHDGLMKIANILRQCGEMLQRQHGREVAGAFNECLDDAERQIEETLDSIAPDDGDSDES